MMDDTGYLNKTNIAAGKGADNFAYPERMNNLKSLSGLKSTHDNDEREALHQKDFERTLDLLYPEEAVLIANNRARTRSNAKICFIASVMLISALLLIGVIILASIDQMFISTWTLGAKLEIACSFIGIPNDIATCQELEHFMVLVNGFEGSLPSEIGLLTKLTHLHLADIQLTGTLPSTLGELTKLTLLDINKNPKLSGSIPSTLGSLTLLTELWLYDNESLTGSIPFTLGNLIQLSVLSLGNNALTGTIPSSLCDDMSELQTVQLYANELSGTIPSSLGTLTQVELLWLDTNTLSGTVPDSLCSLVSPTVDCGEVTCSCCTDPISGAECSTLVISKNRSGRGNARERMLEATKDMLFS